MNSLPSFHLFITIRQPLHFTIPYYTTTALSSFPSLPRDAVLALPSLLLGCFGALGGRIQCHEGGRKLEHGNLPRLLCRTFCYLLLPLLCSLTLRLSPTHSPRGVCGDVRAGTCDISASLHRQDVQDFPCSPPCLRILSHRRWPYGSSKILRGAALVGHCNVDGFIWGITASLFCTVGEPVAHRQRRSCSPFVCSCWSY